MKRKVFLLQSSKVILGIPLANCLTLSQSSTTKSNPDNVQDQNDNSPITLFLSGDVMTGRGIDQILPHSVDPRLYESYVKSAERYVELAESRSGAIPDDVSYRYIWGDALDILSEIDPDVRIINLETAITTSNRFWRKKHIHYRMHPENVNLLTEAGIDLCVLGNNHALDWGYPGLRETLNVLKQHGIEVAGAGNDQSSAAEPATIQTGRGRLLVFSYATPDAGAPLTWGAEEDRGGVNILPDLDTNNAKKVISDVNSFRKNNDRVVVSIHWGSNWGYKIPSDHQEFARQLIDSGNVDIIHGHSSHHPKGVEVYNNRPIIYGCGDLINDYEGIGGREKYRGELSLLYLPRLDSSGVLISLEMIPMKIEKFRLNHPPDDDIQWLAERLDRECKKLGCRIERTPEDRLTLKWN